jgi:hypothetical protein
MGLDGEALVVAILPGPAAIDEKRLQANPGEHVRTASAVSSGPLSERVWSGGPPPLSQVASIPGQVISAFSGRSDVFEAGRFCPLVAIPDDAIPLDGS